MKRLLIALGFAGLLAGGLAAQQLDVGVLVGGEPDLDACGAWGEVTGLNPDGDNFLSVRSGPGSDFQEIDQIGPTQGLFLCDERGKWIGVVYARTSQDCGVSSPIPRQQVYDGPCTHGWVFRKYVKLLAG
jgi:hypothetical protein